MTNAARLRCLLPIIFGLFPVLLLAVFPPRGGRAASAGFDCATVSEIPLEDCQALVALYNTAGGPSWTDNSGWLSTNTPCTSPWYGVECSGGAVSDLDLSTNNLVGSIPAAIGDFTAIQSLILQDNSLTGNIPTEIGNLALLDWLSLSTNQLSGSLPDSIGNLTQLTVLWLDSNQLSGEIPTTFGALTQVTSLLLFENQLSGSIPPQIGNMASLQDLELHNNRLTGTVPPEIGNLVGLFILLLQNNALEGDLPANLASLGAAFLVDVGYNMLTASDPGVIAWLIGVDPDWAGTQTIAPTNVSTGPATDSSIELSWTPITYTADGGYYEVHTATAPAGPFSLHGFTPDKFAASYTAGGLNPATTYYFCIRTFTPAHGSQKNHLWSQAAGPVSGTTSSPFGGCAIPLPPPAAPQGLAVEASGTDALLNWQAVLSDVNGVSTEIEQYRVFRDSDPDVDTVVPITATPALTFTDTGIVAPGTAYFYVVVAEDIRGALSASSAAVGIFSFTLIPGDPVVLGDP